MKQEKENMREKKTVQSNFIEPLKDKQRTMRLNHFLSNRYTLIGLITVLDFAIFFGFNYMTHFLGSIPKLLFDGVAESQIFSIKNVLPDFSDFSLQEFVIGMIILIVIDVILIYRIKVAFSEDGFNVGQKGTSRFTETEEIKQEYKEIAEIEKPYTGMPGFPVSRIDHKLYIDQNVVNNLYIGITRSGKGEIFVKPCIETYSRAEIQPSRIIGDPKLEHYKVFKKKLEERGYAVYLLNCSNPALSMGYNPLTIIIEFYKKKDFDTAEMIANSFSYSYFNVEKATGDMRYFTTAAADLCTAMIIACVEDALLADKQENEQRLNKWKCLESEDREKHPFQYRKDNEKTINFYSMIINFGNLVTVPTNKTGTKTLLDTYFENRESFDRARLKYLSVEVAPGKTKSGVFSEMLREISVFTLHNVAMMTAESTLDFMEIGFGEKPVAVFLATPSYDKSLYKIPTIWIRQMYYALGKACDSYKGRCDRLVKLVLDEAGNMPAIEILETMTTMGLGQNISFDFYLQNYQQLDDVYGEKTAKTIRSNCGNHIYIMSEDEETRRKFSNDLGKKSIIDVQRAGSKLGLNKYFTESVQEKPLLNENELKELREGECVIVRTMKRQDQDGKKIKARPIFNSVENGRYLKYAYEFFGSEYPHPNTVNLLDICTEDRTHIEPRERIWDIKKSFEQQERQEMEVTLLRDLNFEQINQILINALGTHYAIEYGITKDTSLAEFVGFVEQNEMMMETEKEAIMMMV